MDEVKPKTVLIVTTHFPPMRGGVETMNSQYLDFIETQKQIKAVVLTYSAPKQKFNDYWQQSTVIRINVPQRKFDFMTGLKGPNSGNSTFYARIAYVLMHLYYLAKGSILFYGQVKNVDVILANGGVVETMFGYMISMITRKKLLIRWRTDFRFFLSNPINNFVLKSCLRRASIIGVNGKDIEEDIRQFLGNKEAPEIFCAKQTVDTKLFRPLLFDHARNNLLLPADKFIILFAAALIEQKFCDIIVKSAYNILPRDPSFFFIFIGEGPLDEVVRKLNSSFPQNIRFVNNLVDPETLNLYINAADITVGSADVYYPGNFILESLACGTPVLLFDRSAHLGKRNVDLQFEIPLPHIFSTHYSKDELSTDTFLLDNKEKIKEVKHQLSKNAEDYIFRNYEKYRVLKHEFNRFDL